MIPTASPATLLKLSPVGCDTAAAAVMKLVLGYLQAWFVQVGQLPSLDRGHRRRTQPAATPAAPHRTMGHDVVRAGDLPHLSPPLRGDASKKRFHEGVPLLLRDCALEGLIVNG